MSDQTYYFFVIFVFGGFCGQICKAHKKVVILFPKN